METNFVRCEAQYNDFIFNRTFLLKGLSSSTEIIDFILVIFPQIYYPKYKVPVLLQQPLRTELQIFL